MRKRMVKIAAAGAGVAALSLALSPAISAVINGQDLLLQGKVSLKMLGSIGSFTPVTRDQRLARAYADAARESQTRGFKFTPTSGSQHGERSLTVLVRADDSELGLLRHAAPGMAIAPVSYSLGRAKGLDRFASDAGAGTGVDSNEQLSPIVDSTPMPTANFVLQSKPKRFSTNLQVEARQQTATEPTSKAPQTLGTEKSYTVDLSSSYSLTRHLDVQAGVRYRGPDNRLVPLTDQAQDSQAVYVGTKFKF